MVLQPISEQQFRTRRKDRRMVWVDAVAVLVGTALVSATVGAVVFIEPEPEPIEWDHSFFTSTTKHKNCAGITGTTTERAGCTHIVEARSPAEGTTVDNLFPDVEQANVTRVVFALTWVDDTPITEGDSCGNDCGWTYPYDENATDILRLTVHPPNGPAQTIEAANEISTKFGALSLQFDFLPMPETGSVFAFDDREARAEVVDRFTETQHDALGAWRAEVTVVRAGDQNGTVPIDACAAALLPTGQDVPEPLSATPLPSPADDPCHTEAHTKTLEKEPLARDALRASSYEPSYEDLAQSWILEMAIASYETQITVA